MLLSIKLTLQPYGGPVSMIWGWVVSAALIMFIGLAMVGSFTCWRHETSH